MKIKRTPRLFGPMVPIVAVVLMLVVFGMDKAGKISGEAFRNWSFFDHAYICCLGDQLAPN